VVARLDDFQPFSSLLLLAQLCLIFEPVASATRAHVHSRGRRSLFRLTGVNSCAKTALVVGLSLGKSIIWQQVTHLYDDPNRSVSRGVSGLMMRKMAAHGHRQR